MIGCIPDVLVFAGGFRFSVWATDAGISQIILPELSSRTDGKAEHESGSYLVSQQVSVGMTSRFRRHLDELLEHLSCVIAGHPPRVVPSVDLDKGRSFTVRVLEELMKVPYGQKRTYREIASALGNPGASRAVGNAVSRNPLPILVPCHRIVRSDGSLGGWSGPEGWKEYLLALEESSGRVDTGK